MHILSLYTGLLGLIFVYLSFTISGYRKKFQIGIGDGQNETLARAIRVQANFIEYVPISFILLGIFVSNGGNPLVVHVIAATLVIARVLHAYGLGKTVKTSLGRLVGILLTWLIIVVLSGFNIYYFISTQL